MGMKMPSISSCDMQECSYQMDGKCHALAITVGGSHAMCDTFLSGAAKGGVAKSAGQVGACKEGDCRFNEAFECSARGISVGHHGDHPDCLTFMKR